MGEGELAIEGGPKVRTEAFPSRSLFGEEERDAVLTLFDEVIEEGRALTYNGPEEAEYCEQFVEYMGGGYADAVNSGTTAVYTALRALELEPFTEVIVSPITDSGGQMPVPLMGCVPIVADSAPGTYNTGPEQIEECITPRTSAICVGHIAGEPLDMREIMDIADEHDIAVVEDVSQAHGAQIDGRLAGTFGDIAAFSTMSGKHHATGAQGGVVYTQREDLYWQARQVSDRGKPFDEDSNQVNYDPERSNEVASLNFNLNEIAAVIGQIQLKKLPQIVKRRIAIVDALRDEIAGLPGMIVPDQVPGAQPSFWFWRLKADETELSCDKSTLCRALEAEGIPITTRYDARPHEDIWFREQRVFGTSGYPWQAPEYDGDPNPEVECPNSDAVLDSCFNLNISESWGDQEIEDTARAFRKVTSAYAV